MVECETWGGECEDPTYDPQNPIVVKPYPDIDATKEYVDGKILNGGETAPTEDTVGEIGTIYSWVEDGQMNLATCTEITPQGTTPETYKYTWS